MNRRSWTLIVEIYLVSVLASGLGRRARSMSQALLVWLCLLRDEGVRGVLGLGLAHAWCKLLRMPVFACG